MVELLGVVVFLGGRGFYYFFVFWSSVTSVWPFPLNAVASFCCSSRPKPPPGAGAAAEEPLGAACRCRTAAEQLSPRGAASCARSFRTQQPPREPLCDVRSSASYSLDYPQRKLSSVGVKEAATFLPDKQISTAGKASFPLSILRGVLSLVLSCMSPLLPCCHPFLPLCCSLYVLSAPNPSWLC